MSPNPERGSAHHLFTQFTFIMTQQDFVSFLTQRGWEEGAATRYYGNDIIDRDLTVEQWRKTLVGVFCAKHSNLGAIMRLYESLGKVPEWNDLTKPNLAEYKRYLLTRVARNSASAYLHQIAAIMAIHEDDIPAKDFRGVLALKKEPSQHVALTEEEVAMIHRYIPQTTAEADIKRAFMLECLCGARSCDIARLTVGNISDGWLTYVSQKTKTETSVPVHKLLMEYLLKPAHRNDYKRAVVNRVIKRICQRCGITQMVKLYTKGKWQTRPKYELVGSHTARRSFATQLAQRNVPVPTISKLMGHSDVKMTSKYICVDSRNIGDDAMAFFN